MRETRQASGRRGEDVAAAALVARGFTVLARNYRIMSGEVDLVARRGPLLVFVEVKARRAGRWGRGLDSVGFRKQLRIVQAARHYLACHTGGDDAVRFDVIEVNARDWTVSAWVEAAFMAPA